MHKAQVALLNEVKQGKSGSLVLLCNRHHETKVGLHELPLGACAEARHFAQFTLSCRTQA